MPQHIDLTSHIDQYVHCRPRACVWVTDPPHGLGVEALGLEPCLKCLYCLLCIVRRVKVKAHFRQFQPRVTALQQDIASWRDHDRIQSPAYPWFPVIVLELEGVGK